MRQRLSWHSASSWNATLNLNIMRILPTFIAQWTCLLKTRRKSQWSNLQKHQGYKVCKLILVWRHGTNNMLTGFTNRFGFPLSNVPWQFTKITWLIGSAPQSSLTNIANERSGLELKKTRKSSMSSSLLCWKILNVILLVSSFSQKATFRSSPIW